MIGDRRERIRIVTRSRTQRADGGFDLVESTVDRWASVRPVAAREGEDAGRIRGSTIYIIEVDNRGLLTVTPDANLIWVTNGNTVMNIREVRRPPGRALALEIVAEAGAVTSV